jgi:AraC-like DNA-binding protein
MKLGKQTQMGTPNLITRYARAMIYAAEAQGHDLALLCASAEIDPEAIRPDLPEIGPSTFSRLNRAIKFAMDDDFCGFTRSRCKAGSFPMVCESMVHDANLGDALRRAFRMYSFITDDLTFALKEDGDLATITLTITEPEMDTFHYLHEWWLLVWPHISSWLIGEEIPVLRVDLPYEPIAPIEEYTEAFWGPCQFVQPATQVQFPARFLQRRIVRSMRDLGQGFMTTQIDLVEVTGLHRSWRTLIKTKLKECLIKTERLLSIEDLALEFNMSSKTLRRRLDDEEISFRQIKDEIRRELVLQWLSEPNIPIGEVSLRAGFAERNGLVRAVRSWVGLSPKEYRGRMIENPYRSQASVSQTYRH